MKAGMSRGGGESQRRVVRADGHEYGARFLFEGAQPSGNRLGGGWIAELTKQCGDCLGVVDCRAADLHASGKMAVMLLSFHKSSSPPGQF
jgi:hypothetical protein